MRRPPRDPLHNPLRSVIARARQGYAEGPKGNCRWISERECAFEFENDLPPGVTCSLNVVPTFKSPKSQPVTGNASGAPMWDVSGTSGAAPVWAALMNFLHRTEAGRAPPPPPPAGVVQSRVEFRDQLEAARSEWFIQGTEQTMFAINSIA